MHCPQSLELSVQCALSLGGHSSVLAAIHSPPLLGTTTTNLVPSSLPLADLCRSLNTHNSENTHNQQSTRLASVEASPLPLAVLRAPAVCQSTVTCSRVRALLPPARPNIPPRLPPSSSFVCIDSDLFTFGPRAGQLDHLAALRLELPSYRSQAHTTNTAAPVMGKA